MKNRMNNGFTLVELLAVIIVLGIISVIVIPNAMNIFTENNLKVYKIKEKELASSAKNYAEYSNSFTLPANGDIKYITMPQLVSSNYMSKILDSKTGNECTAFVKVTVNNIYGYNYDPCLICDEYSTDKDFCSLEIYNDL